MDEGIKIWLAFSFPLFCEKLCWNKKMIPDKVGMIVTFQLFSVLEAPEAIYNPKGLIFFTDWRENSSNVIFMSTDLPSDFTHNKMSPLLFKQKAKKQRFFFLLSFFYYSFREFYIIFSVVFCSHAVFKEIHSSTKTFGEQRQFKHL